ncbi:pseudouridine synthase [Shewanella insulae]|uniref:23S rRNA pseudouridine(2604) synthase RluF n=1 Tax=Shewanella insulae TaxID=2681496 RepID=UPI001EFDABDC|nr:23S rRNA pseudouridine(2604) synthase RluF [Shewanella insulae]MCG9757295.1 pseudouridine synthase [Shewanella insulae]
MRLAQYLALTGLCSRRAASRLIRDGRVSIGDQLANHVSRVELIQTSAGQQASLTVCVDGQPQPPIADKSYWILNKAVGTDCRLQPQDPASLLHLLPVQPRLYPVGRLDKDSRGLLLLTNDGELTQRLMHPSYAHHKRYHVRLDRPFDDAFIRQMAAGVSYKDVTTLPCQMTRLSPDSFEIVLTQGLNRQIRRMSQALGYKVVDLKRVAIESLTLGDLPVGKMRPLTQAELDRLRDDIA